MCFHPLRWFNRRGLDHERIAEDALASASNDLDMVALTKAVEEAREKATAAERKARSPDRHSTLSEARSRLDRSRFSRPRSHFLAFFKIYKKIICSRANSVNFCQKIAKICKNFDTFWQILQNFAKFSEIRKIFAKFCRIFCRILQECVDFEKC